MKCFLSKYDSSEIPPLDLDSIGDTDASNGETPLFDSLDDEDEDYYEGDLDIDAESDDEDENGSGDLFDDMNDVEDSGKRNSDTDATIYDDIRNRLVLLLSSYFTYHTKFFFIL